MLACTIFLYKCRIAILKCFYYVIHMLLLLHSLPMSSMTSARTPGPPEFGLCSAIIHRLPRDRRSASASSSACVLRTIISLSQALDSLTDSSLLTILFLQMANGWPFARSTTCLIIPYASYLRDRNLPSCAM